MHPEKDLSESVEDYLKAIYDLEQGGKNIGTNQIAASLGVAPASVTSMLKKLAAHEPPMLEYQKHYGVSLTQAGRRAALRTVRRHRLIELFLAQTLGYSWDEVHEEAHHLEHAMSARLEERIAKYLGEPSIDPHGDPIPGADLSISEKPVVALDRLAVGQSATVRRVSRQDAARLRYLAEIGLRPGAGVTLLAAIPYDHTLHIRVTGQAEERVLGPELGGSILVEIEEGSAPTQG